MNPPASLIFDLDGTLSDPAQGIWRSVNFALEAYGFSTVGEDVVSQLIGPPLDQTFRSIIGSVSEELISKLSAKYRERYGDIGYSENILYAGIPDVLDRLSSKGLTLGVCTTKRADFAEKILSLFQIRKHFSFVSGGEVGVPKSQQLGLLLSGGVVSKGSTMIGDRSFDILAARHNGIQPVGVLWGHGSELELRTAGAEVILKHVSQLSQLDDT